jgi:hypothetical protein
VLNYITVKLFRKIGENQCQAIQNGVPLKEKKKRPTAQELRSSLK